MRGGRLSVTQRLLILIGGALLLPAVAALALLFVTELRRERESVERSARGAAETVLARADSKVAEQLAGARVLANAQAIELRDWATAEFRARRLMSQLPDWRSVALADADGHVLFDTRAPRRTALPPPGPNAVGGVEPRGTGCACILIQLPAIAPGTRLVVEVAVDSFHNALMDDLPGDVVAAIADADGRFIARSLDHQGRVGALASPSLRSAIKTGGSGFYRGTTLEGLENYTAYVTSPVTGWSVHVAVDHDRIDTPNWWSRATMVAAALAALLIASAIGAYAIYDLAAERRRHEQMRGLQKAEAIGRFASGVAHDFNNLLMVVIGNIDRMLKADIPPAQRVYAERALAAASRGSRLSNQLLSFARGDGAQIGVVDLQSLFDETDELLRQSVGPGVMLSVRIAPDARWVSANLDQLELAFLNLAVNARDAMESRGAITVTGRREGEDVVVDVIDTGPGLPAGAADRLFEPFFSTKPPGQGTGLGLAQVAGTVRQAGGTVRAANHPDGGAVFTLRLKASPPPSA